MTQHEKTLGQEMLDHIEFLTNKLDDAMAEVRVAREHADFVKRNCALQLKAAGVVS